MRSKLPKVLHELCGRPMIQWPIAAALEAGATSIVVVGSPGGALSAVLPEGVQLAVQNEPLGTGDAVRAAAEHIDRHAPIVILSGDVPLVDADFIRELAEAHNDGAAAATMATMVLADPSGYGRVVRGPGGDVERVVETKTSGDATEDELAIDEVNTGVYVFDGGALLDALEQVQPHNAQGEYYLPDALVVLRESGARIAAHCIDDPELLLGVNDRVDLAEVRAVAQQRIHEMHMRAGVTIVDPASTVIDVDVEIGADSVIEPATYIHGKTAIGSDCLVGPLSTVIDSRLGDGVRVTHSYLVECELHDRATIGPFAYLRPGAVLREGSKAGTFVEIKNSDIGAGTKVPHLSYIGDADVGDDSNLGASTITANYDGRAKHRTRIGKRVHGGVHTSLIAPVSVGDDAYTAAGSTITEDVPDGALGVARAKQRNVEGYSEHKREE
jgi:bifunctional UDP-N-acetylglucosamine pyrophosphorylase/glucosamine-1-phosphate N-acetyltransferase